jgi:hypothetical protein
LHGMQRRRNACNTPHRALYRGAWFDGPEHCC